jgi:hypothetical protein
MSVVVMRLESRLADWQSLLISRLGYEWGVNHCVLDISILSILLACYLIMQLTDLPNLVQSCSNNLTTLFQLEYVQTLTLASW